jgi:excisionase family DNA binding protein
MNAVSQLIRGEPAGTPELSTVELAEQIAARLAPMLSGASPWLTAAEAAVYLRCPLSRVRKLTMTRELPCCRDGRRVLYYRDELDKFIRSGGASCP